MRDDSARIDHMSGFSNDIDELTKEINENTTEDRRIVRVFDEAMNKFASDRSLDACLDALNASIQMANVRRKLHLSYKHYSELLETEVSRLTGQQRFSRPE